MSRSDVAFYVKVGPPGAAPTERVDQTSLITGVKFVDDEAKPDKLTLSVNNFDGVAFESPLWQKGNHLTIAWGYLGNMSPERECVISKIKGGQKLSVEAEAKSILMNAVMKTRNFEQISRSSVVQQIAEENGFGADAQHIEDTEIVFPQVTQTRMSDWGLIRDLARRQGFEAYVDSFGLHFHQRILDQHPRRKFIYYTDPGAGDILDYSVEDDAKADKPGAVTLKGIDPATKKPFEVTANNATDSKRKGLATTLEVVDRETLTTSEKINAPRGTGMLGHTTEATSDAAHAQATGAFRKSQMAAVKLTMTIVMDPQLSAKQVIEVAGLSPSLCGNYYISSLEVSPGDTDAKSVLHCRRDGKSNSDSALEGPGGAGGAQLVLHGVGSKASVNGETAPGEKGPNGEPAGLQPFEFYDKVTNTTHTGFRAAPPAPKKKTPKT